MTLEEFRSKYAWAHMALRDVFPEAEIRDDIYDFDHCYAVAIRFAVSSQQYRNAWMLEFYKPDPNSTYTELEADDCGNIRPVLKYSKYDRVEASPQETIAAMSEYRSLIEQEGSIGRWIPVEIK